MQIQNANLKEVLAFNVQMTKECIKQITRENDELIKQINNMKIPVKRLKIIGPTRPDTPDPEIYNQGSWV